MESKQTSLDVAPEAPPTVFVIRGEQLTSFIRTKVCPLAGVRSVRLNDQPHSPSGELREHVVKGGSVLVDIPPPKTPTELAEVCEKQGHRLRCVGAVRISVESGDLDYAIVAQNGSPSHLVSSTLLGGHSRAYIGQCTLSGWTINQSPTKQGVPIGK